MHEMVNYWQYQQSQNGPLEDLKNLAHLGANVSLVVSFLYLLGEDTKRAKQWFSIHKVAVSVKETVESF